MTRLDLQVPKDRAKRTARRRFARIFGASVLLCSVLSCSSTIKPYGGGPPGAQEGGLEATLKGVLIEQIRAQGAPGIQLSLRVGEEVFHVAAGSADSRRNVPLRTDHVLRVGSVSKLFTAAVVLRLVEMRMLSLSDTIERWFPLLPGAEGISIRSLLNHTSGVFDYTEDRTFQLTTLLFPRKRWEPKELFRFVLRGDPASSPGERYLYSNSNYLLLGIIAERVSGRTYADLLGEGILGPAAMENTFVLPAEQTPPALISGYDRDILPGDLTRIRPSNRSWSSGAFSAGAVASTGSDLLKLIDTVFYGQILSAESLEQMTAFVPATDPDVPYQTGYGLGLRRLEIEGDLLIGHTGTIPGFGAVVMHCPLEDYSIAVLANVSYFDQSSILREVVRLAHGTD